MAKRQCSTQVGLAEHAEVGLRVAYVDGEQHGARSKHADPLDALTLERGEGVVEAAAVGQRKPGIELEQRDEHEAPRENVGVRKRQALGVEFEIAEQKQVDVDHPRAVADLTKSRPS